MRTAAIIVVIFAALGFAGGYLFASLATKVVPAMQEQRAAGPTREVSRDWHYDKWSPGHTQHVVNQVLECNSCHDPAREDFKEVDIGVCTACHEEQASHPHLDEKGEITECFTCHTFKYDSDADGPWDCARCHGAFETPTHTGLARHADVACSSCHHPHKPIEETIRECDDCHKKIKFQHGRPKLSGSCIDCHGGHKLASEASACMECHQSEKPRVPLTATFANGHDSCASCHEPHSFSASSALRCNSCHKRKRVFAQKTAVEHRDCGSCHRPHAVRAAPDASCMGCHEDIASTHTARSKRDCVSCHDPHPKRAAQIVLQCSSCHDEARSDRAFHAGDAACTDCHQPHRFDLSTLGERALCMRCHQPQGRLTSRILGHSSCGSCHEGTAHELTGMVACASCHEEQLAQSPEGHRECMTCHEPHRGTVSARATCGSCHESQELPGLHRIPGDPRNEGHFECTACHDIHRARVRADRATCMDCHTDIADHEPDAKVCTGCHTFIKGRR